MTDSIGHDSPKPSVLLPSVAVFPGSFDPLTFGHVDIVHRALGLFETVIVAVLSNLDKRTLFSAEERCQLIRDEFAGEKGRIVVESFSGLLVNFVRARNTRVVIRGLRAVSDYDYETQMALMNRKLANEIETLFLVTREENSYISSSLVKQVATLGGAVDKFVPLHVAVALAAKVKKV